MGLAIDKRPILVSKITGSVSDNDQKFQIIEDFMRQVAPDLVEMRNILNSQGFSPISVIPADPGMQPGMLVHITGTTAFKAVNTNIERYATAIVTQVGRRNITCYGFGDWDVLCRPLLYPTNKVMYLSDVPGFAQDYDPQETGRISQVVGFKKAATRNTAGRIKLDVKCGEREQT